MSKYNNFLPFSIVWNNFLPIEPHFLNFWNFGFAVAEAKHRRVDFGLACNLRTVHRRVDGQKERQRDHEIVENHRQLVLAGRVLQIARRVDFRNCFLNRGRKVGNVKRAENGRNVHATLVAFVCRVRRDCCYSYSSILRLPVFAACFSIVCDRSLRVNRAERQVHDVTDNQSRLKNSARRVSSRRAAATRN